MLERLDAVDNPQAVHFYRQFTFDCCVPLLPYRGRRKHRVNLTRHRVIR